MRVKDLSKIDLVFKSTLKLIRTHGIAGITMAKIAKKSNLATGTLYIYFKNKEELINALYRKLEKDASNRFFAGFKADLEFKECIKIVWVNYLNHRINFHDESIFMEQYYYSTYITLAQKQLAEEMKQPVYGLINRGKKEGVISSKIETEMMFSAMIGFIRQLADEHVENRYTMIKERVDQAFELSWKMITT